MPSQGPRRTRSAPGEPIGEEGSVDPHEKVTDILHPSGTTQPITIKSISNSECYESRNIGKESKPIRKQKTSGSGFKQNGTVLEGIVEYFGVPSEKS